MRLGLQDQRIKPGTLAHKLYGSDVVGERHRHRYEFNNRYRSQLEDAGLVISAKSMLGALALGDIGRHFPPSDPQWKDADSRSFLRHCSALLRERGWQVGNADVTIVCERPKIGPHADAMRRNLADDVGIDVDAISIKATTTELLGFTGRGEGIAAHAVCLLVRA